MGLVMSSDPTPTMNLNIHEPHSGETVDGYLLGELLGRGAHGAVYRASKAGDAQGYAIKIINLHGHPRSFLDRILRECALTSQLRHPSIVNVHAFGHVGACLYIVMDIASGRACDHFSDGILGWEPSVAVVLRTAQALDYAFSQHRTIHRDIKPANIVIDIRGGDLRSVKVVDFGLSRSTEDAGAGLTMTGAILGTPYYMSPEQAMGRKDLGFQTDLYALGATLFYLVAGRAPFTTGTPIEILMQHCNQPAPRLDAVQPACPPAVADVVARCLAKRPEDRYPDYASFITALEGAVSDNPFEAPATETAPVRRSSTHRVITPTMISMGMVEKPVRDPDGNAASSSVGSDALGDLFRSKMAETTRHYQRRTTEVPAVAPGKFIVPGRPIPVPPSATDSTSGSRSTTAIHRTQGRSTGTFRKEAPMATVMITPIIGPHAYTGPVAQAPEAPASPTLATGTRIDSTFEVLGSIGAGAMGEVYAIQDHFTNRSLALKILSREDMIRPGAVRRFRSEATALATVDHPAFPFFAGKGMFEGRDYLLMERVHGIDLKAWLAEHNGRIDEKSALLLLQQLVQAMNRAHQKCGMVHRDIKPANLMLVDRRTQALKIIDFGVSTYINYGDFEDFSQQEYQYIDDGSQGKAVGTPAYMSPEQCMGSPPSPSMDIYAIGCTFFQFITGRLPFSAPTTAVMMMKHLQEAPPVFDPAFEVTSGSAYILARCLAKNPKDRFKNYQQFEEAIKSALFNVTTRLKRQETTRLTRPARA